MYMILWSTQSVHLSSLLLAPADSFRTFPIHTMTPIWIFPAYPLLLISPLASNLIDALPDAAAAARINSIAIAFGAVCVQGTGFLVSLMIYSAFIYRLMTQKLPRERTRPGMVRLCSSQLIKDTNNTVCLRRTKWVHCRWHRPLRKHCHSKDHAERLWRKCRCCILLQTTFGYGGAMDVGTLPVVLHCQRWSTLAGHMAKSSRSPNSL